jgi:hypothetical protein
MQQRLRGEAVALSLLSTADKASMYTLFQHYYSGIDQQHFFDDLNAKHWVILLRDASENIQGFSSLAISEHQIAGQTVRSIFSGDTIIHHQFWGEQTLLVTWCKFAGTIKAQQPETPLYWFLIVKGHRTYRYLRVFTKHFYPVHSTPTPAHIKLMMKQMSEERYGSDYHPDSGLIQFKTTHGYLKQQWSGINQQAIQKTDIKFFLEKNPGHHQGDELVCLAELSESNLRRFALKAFCHGMQQSLQRVV